MAQLSIAEINSLFDLSDSLLVAPEPLIADSIQKLSHNCMAAVVRHEVIYMGFFRSGDQVPLPVSLVDGYAYSQAEVQYSARWVSNGAPEASGFVSGQKSIPVVAGKQVAPLYYILMGADDSSGRIASNVSYYKQGGKETPTQDGLLKVYAFCQRGDSSEQNGLPPPPADPLVDTLPAPDIWSVAADTQGNLRLSFTIPQNADYETGYLALLVDDVATHLETTLAASVGTNDTTVQLASVTGLVLGDYILIGAEIMQIIGPGIQGVQPTSTTVEVNRGQNLTLAATAANGGKVTRLQLRYLNFVLVAGFTLANPGFAYVENFRPGQVKPYWAELEFASTSGTFSPPVQELTNLVAPNVTGDSASENGVVVDSIIKSLITLAWTNPSGASAAAFGGVHIYWRGFAGNNNWTLFASPPSGSSTYQTILDSTGDLVQFAFVSVNPLGAESDFSSSPGADGSIFETLNGNNTGPGQPQGFVAKATRAQGGIVVLEWNQNVEPDMDHYDIARRVDAITPTSADVIKAVPQGAGIGNLFWEDAPGSAVQPYNYYVRAVDTAGLTSPWAGPRAVSALAPDGTSDTGVPTAPTLIDPRNTPALNALGVGGGDPGAWTWSNWSGQIVIAKCWNQAFLNAFNSNGVFLGTLTVTHWADAGFTTDRKVEQFSFVIDPLNTDLTKNTFITIGLDNRYLQSVTAHITNYYGDSAESAPYSPSIPWTGSQSQGAAPPTGAFNPAVQSMGASSIVGRSAGNLNLTTNSGSAKIVAQRILDASSQGLLIRSFNQSFRPTLNINEIAFWFDSGGATNPNKGGLLFYDGTNYWWFAAVGGGAVTALTNPVG